MLQGVLEVAVGIAAGGILGMFVRYFPSHDQVKKKKLKNKKKCCYIRYYLLMNVIFILFISKLHMTPVVRKQCTALTASRLQSLQSKEVL